MRCGTCVRVYPLNPPQGALWPMPVDAPSAGLGLRAGASPSASIPLAVQRGACDDNLYFVHKLDVAPSSQPLNLTVNLALNPIPGSEPGPLPSPQYKPQAVTLVSSQPELYSSPQSHSHRFHHIHLHRQPNLNPNQVSLDLTPRPTSAHLSTVEPPKRQLLRMDGVEFRISGNCPSRMAPNRIIAPHSPWSTC